MIISVSRRRDIPRFEFGWFMERLKAGYVETANPFNRAQIKRVSLLPEDAEVFVFWTRDPRAILERVEELEEQGRRFYVMTTLTAYPAVLEPVMPPEPAVIAAMEGLAQKLGPKRVIWRYDPLFFSNLTGEDFHLRTFRRLARALQGVAGRVIISLYDAYAGAGRRVARLEREGLLHTLPHENGEGLLLAPIRALLESLAYIAREQGIPLYSCAEGEALEALGIQQGACIDGALIGELWGVKTNGKDRNQRPRCGCVSSVDIGRYGDCPAGCVYCYARR